MDRTRYYQTLGLDPARRYTTIEIRQAWLELTKQHHPDVGGDPQRFIEITHAYEMLTNPEYFLTESRKQERRNLDVTLTLPITFADAFFGKQYHLTVNIIDVTLSGAPVFKSQQELETLSFEADPFTIFADPHTSLLGKGNRCGSTRGNLTVAFVVERSNIFTVSGLNVASKLEVPLEVYLLGGDVTIQTMYGLQTATVMPGQRDVTLPNCGIRRKGHHTVTLDPTLPSTEQLKTDLWTDLLDIEWERFTRQPAGGSTHQ